MPGTRKKLRPPSLRRNARKRQEFVQQQTLPSKWDRKIKIDIEYIIAHCAILAMFDYGKGGPGTY